MGWRKDHLKLLFELKGLDLTVLAWSLNTCLGTSRLSLARIFVQPFPNPRQEFEIFISYIYFGAWWQVTNQGSSCRGDNGSTERRRRTQTQESIGIGWWVVPSLDRCSKVMELFRSQEKTDSSRRHSSFAHWRSHIKHWNEHCVRHL